MSDLFFLAASQQFSFGRSESLFYFIVPALVVAGVLAATWAVVRYSKIKTGPWLWSMVFTSLCLGVALFFILANEVLNNFQTLTITDEGTVRLGYLTSWQDTQFSAASVKGIQKPATRYPRGGDKTVLLHRVKITTSNNQEYRSLEFEDQQLFEQVMKAMRQAMLRPAT